MSGDGDGWVLCAAGHRHWGLFGAAGLLISDGERAILQHRAPWTHEGGTWGLPGGARDSHEDPTMTALREAAEEADLPSAGIEPVAVWIDDHGGWSYTTVLARPRGRLAPHAANAESTEIRWWPETEVDNLPLHHGFAGAWPHLRYPPVPLSIVIDARAGSGLSPADRSDPHLDQLARYGIPVEALPDGIDWASTSRLLPSLVVIVDDLTPMPAPAEDVRWWRRGRQVFGVNGDDPNAVARAAIERDEAKQVIVVTGDRALAAQLPTNVSVSAPDWLAALQ